MCKDLKIDYTISCILIMSSHSQLESFTVNYGDSLMDTSDFNGILVSYFGVGLPYNYTNITDNNNILLSGKYLLINSEFQFDSELVGFEFICNSPGDVIIHVVSFNDQCGGIYDSCAFLITNKTSLLDYKILHTFTYNAASVGFNTFEFDIPIRIPKGSMIIIDTTSGSSLSTNTDENNIYSDYKIINQNSIEPINKTINSRFYFNSKIVSPYYTNTYKFLHQYSIFGNYNVTIKFDNQSSSLITRYLYLKNG